MESLLYNISQVLGITIIHSLWQGLIIYFVLRMALAFGNKLSAATKYLFALGSLFAMSGWFIYTLTNEISIYNWLAVKPTELSAMPVLAALPAPVYQVSEQSIRNHYNIEKYLPYITFLYVAGLLFNTCRLIIARKKINTITQNMSIDIALQYSVNKFTAMFNIGANVKVGLSKLVDVPCMIGYFKPVILLPFTLSTYLSVEEIEAILLHELSHIKRNDYLVNLIQQVISILLFFNPCALLINKIINEERENCCDDLVVKATANPVTYAKALLKLEQTRQNDWKLALAATGKKYHLLNRIERIMKTKKTIPSLRPALLATLILTIGIGGIALLKPEIAHGEISVKAISHVVSTKFADTSHKKSAVVAKKPLVAKKTLKAKSDVKGNEKSKTYYAYSDNNDESWDFHDAELDRLSNEVEKYGDAVSAYFDSPKFQKQSEDLDKKGQAIDDFYNRPEVRRLEEQEERLSSDFEKKWGENDEMRSTSDQMEKLGEKIEKYYDSNEFTALKARLEKKYGIPADRFNSDEWENNDNYKKYEAEIKQNTPADVIQAKDELHRLGSKIKEYYHSPEREKEKQQLRETGDSLKRALHSPEIGQKKAEMRELKDKMHVLKDNPEIMKQKALLHDAKEKLHAYMRSPGFRKRLDDYKKTHKSLRDRDGDEHPDEPQKPAAPEKN